MTQTIASGRDAFERHSWAEAYRELSDADAQGELDPEDLETLADAAWFTGRVDEAMDALERSYLGHVKAGSKTKAAWIAIRLSERAYRGGEAPVAQGWLSRAERLVEGEPESVVHAWFGIMRAFGAIDMGSPDQAIIQSDRAIELGRAFDDPDVEAIGLALKGAAMTRLGRVEEGLALLDEATAAATSGELRVKTACDVYCLTISACHEVSDLRRSTEWTDRAERYMHQSTVQGYPGSCKVHRAEVKRYQGRWAEAEEEARAACEELEHYRLLDILGAAHNEIGEIRLRVGDLKGAESAFTKAYEYGWDPQPGLALLHLARGDAAEAARSLGRSLGTGATMADFVQKVQRLPAKVEIDLALDDHEGARAAADELSQLADDHENPIWTAAAATARGRVELAEGDLESALSDLGTAWRQWRDLDFPYDSARARTVLAQARRDAGDESGALLELNAALTVLRELGAVREVDELTERFGIETEQDGRSTATMTFMFTDIVTSTDLIGLIGDEAWANLLDWHDRTLQREFASHGGEVVNHMGDGFFVAFADPKAAVACAVDIQLSLRRHRHDHGFSPSIRIGIHRAEAKHSDAGYTGRGVHIAARVSAEARSDEILVTAATVESVAGLANPTSDVRSVSLKGISEPIEVCSVDWMS